jgi:hypothetical protein
MKKTYFPLFLLAIIISGCDSTSENKIVTAPPSAGSTAPTSTATAFPKEEAEKLIKKLATQDGCKDSTAEMRLSFTDAEGKPQQMAQKFLR